MVSPTRLSIHGMFLFFLSVYLLIQTKIAWWHDTSEILSVGSSVSARLADAFRSNVVRKRRRQPKNGDDDDDKDGALASSSPDSSSWPEFFGENVSIVQDEGEVQKALEGLPSWIVNYVTWHRQIRKKFPGKLLMEHPDAPPILMRTCFGICGGLNDRLGQLPWDLHLANITGRLLLLHWHRPAPLEHYLVPNFFDWRVPLVDAFEGFFPDDRESLRCVPPPVMRQAKFQHKGIFQNMKADQPEDDFFLRELPMALERATVGEYKDEKVLRHRLLGHLKEKRLEDRLRAAGETDMIHDTTTYGRVFELFFRPAPRIQKKLDAILSSQSFLSSIQSKTSNNNLLQPYHYTAVHCRVRHPKVAVKWRPTSAGGETVKADKKGLLWEGDSRAWAIRITNHALQCATVHATPDGRPEPIYLLADSGDLVNFYANELYNSTYRAQHETALARDPVEAKALELSQSMSIVSRPLETETVHLDLQKGRPAPAYDDTFVDFFLLLRARCLVFGVGNFAWLAAKINKQAAECNFLHQAEAWGEVARKVERTPLCPIEEDETKLQG